MRVEYFLDLLLSPLNKGKARNKLAYLQILHVKSGNNSPIHDVVIHRFFGYVLNDFLENRIIPSKDLHSRDKDVALEANLIQECVDPRVDCALHNHSLFAVLHKYHSRCSALTYLNSFDLAKIESINILASFPAWVESFEFKRLDILKEKVYLLNFDFVRKVIEEKTAVERVHFGKGNQLLYIFLRSVDNLRIYI